MSRGYGSAYSPAYYPTYGSTLYRSSGSTYMDGSRSSTPGRNVTSMSHSILVDDRKRDIRTIGLTPTVTPAAYKYFSRSDFYNPTIIFNRSMSNESTARKQELITVKTEDLDLESNSKDTKREHAIPGAIKRDTAHAGGKQVIRLVTTKQKTNPYNIVGNGEDLTMGQKLARKHFLRDPQKLEETTKKVKKKHESDSDWSSDWTWETCSEDDEEGVSFDLNKDGQWIRQKGASDRDHRKVSEPRSDDTSATSTCSARTVRCDQPVIGEVAKNNIERPYQSILSKYRSKTPATEKHDQVKSETKEPEVPLRRNNYDWLRPPKPAYTFNQPPSITSDKKSSSSSTSSPTPIAKVYTPFGSKAVAFSSDEEIDNANFKSAWRRGQPPRSDCVIKLTKQNEEKVKRRHSEVPKSFSDMPERQNRQSIDFELGFREKTTNRLLVSEDTPGTVNASQEPESQQEEEELGGKAKSKPMAGLSSVKLAEESLLKPTLEERAWKAFQEPKSQLEGQELQSQVKVQPLVRLPPFKFAEENYLESNPEEKAETLAKASADLQVLDKATCSDADLGDNGHMAVEIPIPELLQDMHEVRPSNPVATTVECDDDSGSFEAEEANQVSTSDGRSENYYPSDEDTDTSSLTCENRVVMKGLLSDQITSGSKENLGRVLEIKECTSDEKTKEGTKTFGTIQSCEGQEVPKQTMRQAAQKVKADIIKLGNGLKDVANRNTKNWSKALSSDDESCSSFSFGGPSESDAAFIASQLDRIPSPMRKIFEVKTKIAFGEEYIPEVPKEKPKYWNNHPKETSNSHYDELVQMRSEQKRHQKKVKEEQMALLSSEQEAEEAWYKDESKEMQGQLQQRLQDCERRPSDLNRPDDERKTPQENMAIIQLYGGVQFPDTMLDMTPLNLLKKSDIVAEQSGAGSLRDSPATQNGEK